MEEFTLQRTGLPPLRFRGEQLAEVDGSELIGGDPTRWHDLAVYRTAGGAYVLEITYQTKWDRETGHVQVAHELAPGDLIGVLTAYDPLAHLAGFPPGDAYREKQRRLEDDVCRRFRAGITRLYDRLPLAWFAEEIA